ncbi:hypothetical protein DSO57_1000953 [Entomophthora muscae]|uniref:Uncharacterized protein n=2 Tax=Entomophthora muscae TaxID=34485 RepID=A0ACC2UI30_9FUNG|nr:hypothetical protein DSO57_1038123 [Entomophthora muscae]KAJ9086693.1 hypothetical protein DSO57_1000953 [Entomophthora muscae]
MAAPGLAGLGKVSGCPMSLQGKRPTVPGFAQPVGYNQEVRKRIPAPPAQLAGFWANNGTNHPRFLQSTLAHDFSICIPCLFAPQAPTLNQHLVLGNQPVSR